VDLLSYIRAKHNLILKSLFVLVSSFILACIQPKEEVKGHKVDSFDAVWPYKDLVVESDFFIKKSESELKEESDEIEKNSPLFFVITNSEKEIKLKNLELLKRSNAAAYKTLKPIFDSLYTIGVIETVSPEQIKKPVFITSGNYSEQSFYFNYFTIESSIKYIEDRLKLSVLKNNASVNYIDYLAITLFLDQEKTKLFLNSKLEEISIYKSIVRAGETLVKQGESLTNNKRFLINRYFYLQNRHTPFSMIKFMANWFLFFIILLVLLFYLAFFRKNIFGQNKQVFFLFAIVVVCALTTYVFYKFGLIILAIPFGLVPILVRVFFDSRTALFTHLIAVLTCSFFMPDKLEFILLQLISGIGTLFAVAEMRKRHQVLISAIIVFVIYCVLFFSYQISNGSREYAFKLTAYIPFAISSVLVLLAYPIIYLVEKLFGFISDFKLLELSDLNQPLLRQLSQEVPGTFQHSLQVANLAEEVIYYIGGNSLLVRTGAMYHDIGKLSNPRFFTENQVNGYSPHVEMLPVESAKTIINHVINGIELAKKHVLPEQIIDFIRTHHGTTSVGYFLNLYKKEKVLSDADENEFRYPGPIPFSKETAVLMMADGVEAASRSLQKHDALAINDLVDKIIDYKITQNQFINSDITFKDITVIKKIFKKRLMNIYHVRIEYPS
jgi:putative nucleotidyltransferase with HDIG domain